MRGGEILLAHGVTGVSGVITCVHMSIFSKKLKFLEDGPKKVAPVSSKMDMTIVTCLHFDTCGIEPGIGEEGNLHTGMVIDDEVCLLPDDSG